MATRRTSIPPRLADQRPASLGGARTGRGAFVSVLDLFRIGVGPSSSHTVGPMRAAAAFAEEARGRAAVDAVECVLYGSLGSTGPGHGTPAAVLAGLAGAAPETVEPRELAAIAQRVGVTGRLALAGGREVSVGTDWVTLAPREVLPRHPNALRLRALGPGGEVVVERVYYSVGGGFVETDAPPSALSPEDVPYPFTSGASLLATCRGNGLNIAQVALANEGAVRPERETRRGIARVWSTMRGCIEAGLEARGTLPGGLRLPRRAGGIAQRLRQIDATGERDTSMEWLQAYAIAVNEENASGGRVVTAPTNGAAGVIPAVLRYALEFAEPAVIAPELEFLLVAAAIGSLYKANASISGAEAGCQGEIGSACSMAAAGFCHILGGSIGQVENAAEIAMEHNLGLTCDPVSGLVQMPCIERNAIGAGTAVAAARMAMYGDGSHRISLDAVIETMRETGRDMSSKYKETSAGGLAVNVVEC